MRVFSSKMLWTAFLRPYFFRIIRQMMAFRRCIGIRGVALLVVLLMPFILVWLKMLYDQVDKSRLLISKLQLTSSDCNFATDINFHSPMDFQLERLDDEMTVVTAYFNIGSFSKGAADAVHFTSDLYRQWMTSYALIDNPLIAFMDNVDDLEYFRLIRSRQPANRTCLVLVDRSQLWSLSPETESRISAIYKQPTYPKHYPNTVVPLYSMAMYAKYEVVQAVVRRNPFSTRYACWLDIGLFRDYTVPTPSNWSSNPTPFDHLKTPPDEPFRIYLPPYFNSPEVEDSSIAVCQVYKRQPHLTPSQIVSGNEVWIGGGFFAGRIDVVDVWTVEFLSAVHWMLDMNLSSTDQQVIYSLFNAAFQGLRPLPRTRLLRYEGDGSYDRWFHLAYISRDEGLARSRRHKVFPDYCRRTPLIGVCKEFQLELRRRQRFRPIHNN